MAAFTVRRGRRYRATIALSVIEIERWADNETIAGRLRAAGFSEVNVTGTGDSRVAEALRCRGTPCGQSAVVSLGPAPAVSAGLPCLPAEAVLPEVLLL